MCLVPKYGIEVAVFVTASNQPNGYKLADDGMSHKSAHGSLKMLDKLRVEIRVEELAAHRQRLKCAMVRPGHEPVASSTPTEKAGKRAAEGTDGNASGEKKAKTA